MAPGAGSETRGDFVSRRRTAGPAQGRILERYDARDGQGARRNAWRCPRSDRYDLLHGRRRATFVWANDSFGTAKQIRHERAAVHWGVRNDHALEFSDGHSVLENDAGADLRKYSGHQAC